MKTSKKNLIELSDNLNAVDITYKSFEEMQELIKKEQAFNSIAQAFGIYGINAEIVQGYKTKTFYVIKSRTSAIFMV